MNDETSVWGTGIRPLIDSYLAEKAAEERDYGEYWSASSAGYCMRKVIFDRLKVPIVTENARKIRVFEAGHIFHALIQAITAQSGKSVAQEMELLDENLLIKGHIDDLVYINKRLILYDFKTQHSRAFHYSKDRPMSHYHHMQLGTYMYMLRKLQRSDVKPVTFDELPDLTEARILKISKDDLSMSEEILVWSVALAKEVHGYWATLNGYWKNKVLPRCTCADVEGGFMARDKYNPYFYEQEPCSVKWAKEHIKELETWKIAPANS